MIQGVSIPCLIMASINFYVGAQHIAFYAMRPQSREYLPFSLLCFSVGLYDLFSIGLYSATTIEGGMFWQRFQLDTVIAISIFLIWFTSVFTEQKKNKIIRFSIIWFVLLFLLSFVLDRDLTLSTAHPAVKHLTVFNQPITYYEVAIGSLYQLEILSAVVAYLYLVYLLVRHYGRTRDKALLVLLSCQVAYFFGVINDSMVAIEAYGLIYISEYVFFLIVLAMAYTLLERFVSVHRAFEELNVNLERKVGERTAEIEKLNQHLKILVDYDGLTGVYNRRFLNEYLDIEFKRAKNYLQYKGSKASGKDDMNFGLAIIDVDGFKQINDTHGHLVGDAVLKEVTDVMKNNSFSRDVLCRYGGDEFALLLTKTSNEGILQAAEKIRKEIEEHSFSLGEEAGIRHLTISVGLVYFDEVFEGGGEQALRLADDRLLEAKGLGKNRVVHRDTAHRDC